jgi:hypothetical protein
MMIRGLLMGTTLEAAFWAAIVALMGWALVRFFHGRSTLRRIAAGRGPRPLRRSASES